MQDQPSAFPERYFGVKQPYSSVSGQQVSKAKRRLYAFIQSLPENATVLDVGCGSGKAIKLVRLLRPDVRISGIDISDMRQFLPEGVEFRQGSVDDLRTLYAPESFDGIICQHVIEHLVTPLSLMSGIQTLLKSGGSVYLETPNWTRLFVPFSHLYFWNDYTHIHPYSAVTLQRLFFDFAMDADVYTISTCSWFPKRNYHTVESGAATAQLKNDGRGPLSRLTARIVNPLLRDTVIVVARK